MQIEYSDGNSLHKAGHHDRYIGADASNGGKIVFYDDNSHLSHYTTLQGGNNMAANWKLTLPTAAPTSNGQALTATTAGQASWSDVSSTVANGCIYENDQTISADHTIASGKGAHSVGPITVNATVTVNGNWVVS